MNLSVGEAVVWEWGSGTATGTVIERFEERVSRRLKGAQVTRNATRSEPAVLIEQDDGDRVLKSITEVKKA